MYELKLFDKNKNLREVFTGERESVFAAADDFIAIQRIESELLAGWYLTLTKRKAV